MSKYRFWCGRAVHSSLRLLTRRWGIRHRHYQRMCAGGGHDVGGASPDNAGAGLGRQSDGVLDRSCQNGDGGRSTRGTVSVP